MGDGLVDLVKFVPVEQALAMPRRRWEIPDARWSIYALTTGGRAFYVGVTRGALHKRLRWHIERPVNGGMAAFLAGLDKAGVRPEIVRIEWVGQTDWEDAERGWIYWFRQRGDLLNVDRGGQARDGHGRLRPFAPGAYQEPRARQGAEANRTGLPRQRDRWERCHFPMKVSRQRQEPRWRGSASRRSISGDPG